jgi:hypothetical protein
MFVFWHSDCIPIITVILLHIKRRNSCDRRQKRLTRKPACVNTGTSHYHNITSILLTISELLVPDQDTDGAEVSFVFTSDNSSSITETPDSGINSNYKCDQKVPPANNERLQKIGSFLTAGRDTKLTVRLQQRSCSRQCRLLSVITANV